MADTETPPWETSQATDVPPWEKPAKAEIPPWEKPTLPAPSLADDIGSGDPLRIARGQMALLGKAQQATDLGLALAGRKPDIDLSHITEDGFKPSTSSEELGARNATGARETVDLYNKNNPQPPQFKVAKPRNVFERMAEGLRDSGPVENILGPSERKQAAEAIPWTNSRTGQTSFVYKPLGDKIEREGLIPAALDPNKIAPRVTAEDIEKGNWKALLPGVDPETGESPNSLKTPGYQPGMTAQVAAGAARGAAGFAEVLSNPMLLAGLAAGGTAPLVSRAISVGFGVKMASDLPAVVDQVNQAAERGDVGGITEALVGGGLDAYFAVKTLQHGLGRTKVPQTDAQGNPIIDPATKKQAFKTIGLAEESPLVRKILTKSISEQYDPQTLREIKNRVNIDVAERNTAQENGRAPAPDQATPAEHALIDFIDTGLESDQKGYQRGVNITTSTPRIESKFWQDYLGLKPSRTVTAFGEQAAAGSAEEINESLRQNRQAPAQPAADNGKLLPAPPAEQPGKKVYFKRADQAPAAPLPTTGGILSDIQANKAATEARTAAVEAAKPLTKQDLIDAIAQVREEILKNQGVPKAAPVSNDTTSDDSNPELSPVKPISPTAETTTETKTATALPADTTQNASQPAAGEAIHPLTDALEKYEGTGEIETVGDLVNHVDGLIGEGKAPESLMDAVETYRQEQEDDRKLGGRGDMDQAGENFINTVRSAIPKADKKTTPNPFDVAEKRAGNVTGAKVDDGAGVPILEKHSTNDFPDGAKGFTDEEKAALEDAKKTGTITIHRAVIKGQPIRAGDFVTLQKSDAEQYLTAPGTEIVSQKVPVSDVHYVSGTGTWPIRYKFPGEVKSKAVSSMSREQYAQYLVENPSASKTRGQSGYYSELTRRPELRGQPSITPSKEQQADIYGRIPEIAKAMGAADVQEPWIHVNIGDSKTKNPDGSRSKLYITFKDWKKSWTPENVGAYVAELRKNGFNGAVKTKGQAPFNANKVLNSFDDVVTHAKSEADITIAQEAAKKVWGDSADYQTGLDAINPATGEHTSHTDLLASAVANAVGDKSPNIKLPRSKYAAPVVAAETGAKGNAGTKYAPGDIRNRIGKAPESADESMHIGTRNASGKSATDNPVRDNTVVDVASMRRDPELVSKINDLIRSEYPQIKIQPGEEPINALIRHVKGNLRWLHDQMPEAMRERAKQWYVGARKITESFSEKYQFPREAVAGAIAKLSPQRDWFQNLELAERVMAILKNTPNGGRWTSEMDHTVLGWIYYPQIRNSVGKLIGNKDALSDKTREMLRGKLEDLRGTPFDKLDSLQKAIWVRAYSSAHMPRGYSIWTPEGERLGIKLNDDNETESKLGWPGFGTVEGAISILENPSKTNISDQLGGEHKIRNFYNNILLPNSKLGSVTIDTHAVAAAVLKALAGADTEVGHNFGQGAPGSDVLGISGLYPVFADAYRELAKELGLLPRELQSITWEEIRALFTDDFKTKANKKLVNSIWQEYINGKATLDETRELLKDVAEYRQPDWVGKRRGSAPHETPWDTSDHRELPGTRRSFEGRSPRRGSEKWASELGKEYARSLGSNNALNPEGFFSSFAAGDSPFAAGENQTDTPEFKKWFGDSKVVDNDGKPLVVYHGTSQAGFEHFDPYASNYGLMGDGSYFTESKEVASTYTNKGKGDSQGVYPTFLKIQNPLDFDAEADLAKWKKAAPDVDFTGAKTNEDALRKLEEYLSEEMLPKWEGAERVNGIIRAMGYDGGTHMGGGRVKRDSETHRVWIALDPEQIKSATGNRGTFDPNDANILHAAGGDSETSLTGGKSQSKVLEAINEKHESQKSNVGEDTGWQRWLDDVRQRAKPTFGRLLQEARARGQREIYSEATHDADYGQTPHGQRLQAVARAAGSEVIFYKADRFAPRGVSNGGHIFVNSNLPQTEITQIFEHELAHQNFTKGNKQLWRLYDLVDLNSPAAKAFRSNYDEWLKKVGQKPLTDAEVREELVVDLVAGRHGAEAFKDARAAEDLAHEYHGGKVAAPKTEAVEKFAAGDIPPGEDYKPLVAKLNAAKAEVERWQKVIGNPPLREREGVTKQEAVAERNLATARYRGLQEALKNHPGYVQDLLAESKRLAVALNDKSLTPEQRVDLETQFEEIRNDLEKLPKRLVSKIMNDRFLGGDDKSEQEKAAGAEYPGMAGARVSGPGGEIEPESRLQKWRNDFANLPQTIRDAKGTAMKGYSKIVAAYNAGDIKDMMKATFDAAENGGNIFGKQAANEILNTLNRSFNAPPDRVRERNPVREAALTFVVESGRDEATLRDFRRVIEGSEFAGTKSGKAALAAIDFAETHWDRLEPVAELYQQITDAQVDHENSAGIETLHRKGGYVFHTHDVMAGHALPDVGSGGGFGPSAQFLKTREYPTYADAVAGGEVPKTLNAVDLLQKRLAIGQKLVNHGAWIDGMRRVVDPTMQKPIVDHVITKVRQDGKEFDSAPPGYVEMSFARQKFAVLKGYDGLFKALVTPSTIRNSLPGSIAMSAAGGIKHGMLLFDSYHLGRLMFWNAFVRGNYGLPGNPAAHKVGLTLLDYSTGEIAAMMRNGELPESMGKDLIESKRQLSLLIARGLNVGGVADNIAPHLIQDLPVIGTFNKFLFQKFQRGATAEGALIELRRQMKNNPGADESIIARQVAKAMNVRFGNLQNQSVVINKNVSDILRMLFLAPQWNESLIRSELGAGAEAIHAGKTLVTKGRFDMGMLGRVVAAAVLGQLLINQILNYLTRGHSTFENPEESYEAKLSAWIPDVVGNGPGFFLNPLTLPAEISSLLFKATERTGDFTKALKQYFAGRLGPLGRVPYTLAVREDATGAKLKTAGEVFGQMATGLAPVPISGGTLARAGKQLITGQPEEKYPGQFERQAFQTLGVKLDSAPNPEQRIKALASAFNREHGKVPNGDYSHSDYYGLDSALSVGNEKYIQQELSDLLLKKTAKDIRFRYRDRINDAFTGGKKSFEAEFKDTLNPEQIEQYQKAQDARRARWKQVIEALNQQTK
jgi:hypothetical protein